MPFCTKCGVTVSEDARFCPNCGAVLRPIGGTSETKVARPREEKGEKREKEEKHEKSEKSEKGESRSGSITGGLVLIWLGTTLYLATTGIISWDKWVWYFLIGIGVTLLVSAIIDYSSSRRIGLVIGPVIGGGILIVIGAVSILGVTNWWWVIPIGIGVAIIVSALRERRQTPKP
jgi:hypothetical protein